MTDERTLLEWVLAKTAERVMRSISDVSQEEAAARPQGLTPIIWQLGHVLLTEAFILRRFGQTVDLPPEYDTLFAMGSGGEADYPSIDEIRPLLGAINERLCGLAASAPFDQPLEGSKVYGTVGEALAFMPHHRGYHVGKITTLRGLLGKSRLFG